MVPDMIEKGFILPNYPSLKGLYGITLSTADTKKTWRKRESNQYGQIYTNNNETYYLIVEYWRK